MGASNKPRRVGIEPCSVKGCPNKIKALNVCAAHWWRLKFYGSTKPEQPLKGFREVFTVCRDKHGDFIKLPIASGMFTLIDLNDFKLVGGYAWHPQKKKHTTYARGETSSRKKVFLHNVLIPLKPGLQTDHEDGDGLNNRRYNLRRCTPNQNQANRRKSSCSNYRYKGVWFEKDRGLWRSAAMVKGKSKYCGRFNTELEAAKAYDVAAKKYFGKFARLNFPKL